MALSDFYDFGPLMAQLRQGGQGMSGVMGTPQNSWSGSQFVMPQVAQPGPYTQLAPYKGTAMAPGNQAPQQGLFGSMQGTVPGGTTGRPGGINPRNMSKYFPGLGGLMG